MDHDDSTSLICCDTGSKYAEAQCSLRPIGTLTAPNHNVAHTKDENLLLTLMPLSLRIWTAPAHPTGFILALPSL